MPLPPSGKRPRSGRAPCWFRRPSKRATHENPPPPHAPWPESAKKRRRNLLAPVLRYDELVGWCNSSAWRGAQGARLLPDGALCKATDSNPVQVGPSGRRPRNKKLSNGSKWLGCAAHSRQTMLHPAGSHVATYPPPPLCVCVWAAKGIGQPSIGPARQPPAHKHITFQERYCVRGDMSSRGHATKPD